MMPTRPRMSRRPYRVAGAMLVGGALLAAGALASTATAAPAPEAGDATILYVNDAHEIGPVLSEGQDRGGVARLRTAIDTVRAQNPDTAVTFGGDLAGGTLFGGLYQGHPMVEAFNVIGFDVANFGQHDFDFGVANTRELVAASEFPWISSNLALPSGEPFAERTWFTQDLGGVTIGYIGLSDAMDTTSVRGEVIERDHVEAAREAVAAMEAEAAPDVVVALTQVGIERGREIADAVPELDAVLLEEQAEYDSVVEDQGGVVLAAPEGNMGSLIRLDVTETSRGFDVVPSVVEVDHTVTPDPELRAVEERYEAEMAATLAEELATVPTPLLRGEHRQRQGESEIGNALADAFRAHYGADIGWVNGGGVRADIPGPVMTLRDAYSVFPFDNKVMHARVTGAALRQGLEQAAARVQDLGGGFPQVAGMAFELDATRPPGERIGAIHVGGRALDEAATYSIALTNYVFNGGDGVDAFLDGEVLAPADGAPADAEVLAGYAREVGEVTGRIEGRIVGFGEFGAGEEPAPGDDPTTGEEPVPEQPPTDEEPTPGDGVVDSVPLDLTVTEDADSPWTLTVDTDANLVVARHDDGAALHFDYDDEADDGHFVGISPYLGDGPLEGSFWGATTSFIYPILDPADHQLTTASVATVGGELRISMAGGSYAVLDPDSPVADDPLTLEAVFTMRHGAEGTGGPATLRADLEGLTYLMPSKDPGTAVDITTADGTEISREVTMASPTGREYIDDPRTISVEDGTYGPIRIETDLRRLQIDVNANPALSVFELDADHTFKDLGQTSVRYGIDFGPVAGTVPGAGGDIPVQAEIPGTGGPGEPGALALTVAPGALDLGQARNAGDRWRLGGALPHVSVTDTRSSGGWSVTGQSSALTAGDDAAAIAARHLGWTPHLVDGAARPGAAVAPELSGGPGLAVPATLGAHERAEGEAVGNAVLGADVTLEAPVTTGAGTYTGAVTVSLFPTD